MLYFHRTPKVLEWFYPGLTWHMGRAGNEVFLTFDDGPVPEMTPEILELLRTNNVPATFFCVGDNVRKHPGILKEVVGEGHAVGNHTFHHISGWSVSSDSYCEEVAACDSILGDNGIQTSLFRPPYGKISKSQARRLLKDGRKIIMWDVLTADFDRSLSWSQCLERTTKHIRPGSIIVLHDNPKARERTIALLPRLIEYIKAENLKCSLIPY